MPISVKCKRRQPVKAWRRFKVSTAVRNLRLAPSYFCAAGSGGAFGVTERR